MRLKSSSEVKAEASTRTKQSKIKFSQPIKLDRLKTLAITHTKKDYHSSAIVDIAPQEEEKQMQLNDLQHAIAISLEYFSKHTIDMDLQPETGRLYSTCKGVKTSDQFEGSFKTCNDCITTKRKRRRTNKAEANLAKKKADSREGERLCSSKKWCPSIGFTGGKKTCDTCIKSASESLRRFVCLGATSLLGCLP